MADLDDMQQRILTRLSTAGQEAVPFDLIQREIAADPKLIAAALRGLLEGRQVTLRRGSAGDTQTYLSLAHDLTESVSVVLDAIRASGTTGVDQVQLASKLRLAKTEVLKALHSLMAQKLIQERRSFTNRAKRIYLLYNLEPSAQVTGGTFYCGEELDVAYVDELRRRIVAFVSLKLSVSLDQIVRYLEEACGGGGGAFSESVMAATSLSSPITFINASGASDFATVPPTTPLPNNKRLARRDVLLLTQTLVLDGVLDEVQPSERLEVQYQLSSGCNVMRHFTCQRKRSRAPSANAGNHSGSTTAPSSSSSSGGVTTSSSVSAAADALVREALAGHFGSTVAASASSSSSGDVVENEESTQIRRRRQALLTIMAEEGLWEPAPISQPSAGEGNGWAYMPASGLPCLGCPQLAMCSTSGKGIINPRQCAYLKEWLN